MDDHTLTGPSDISAGLRAAGLGRRMRHTASCDGCSERDTWAYRGTPGYGLRRQPAVSGRRRSAGVGGQPAGQADGTGDAAADRDRQTASETQADSR